MGALLNARRRAIRRAGRTMTVTRMASDGTDAASTDFLGFLRMPGAEMLADGFPGTDGWIETLADEFQAGSYPLPVRAPDVVVAGSVGYSVASADPVYEGETLIGYTIRVRGS